MKAAIFFTPKGRELAERLREHYPELRLYTTRRLAGGAAEEMEKPLGDFVAKLWRSCEWMVFISAVGIAVRAIAPSVKSKLSDPGVVCIDEGGNYAISLLSGHLGGANQLAGELAEKLGAIPVVTTSTDLQGLPSLEGFAEEHSLEIENSMDIRRANSAIASGKKLAVLSDILENAEGFPLYPLDSPPRGYDFFILVTNRLLDFSAQHVFLRPRNLVAGVGFSSRAKGQEIAGAVRSAVEQVRLSPRSLYAIATVDFKANSLELKSAAELLEARVISLPREKIAEVEESFEGSEFVRSSVGVGSVAEPSAFFASGGGKVLAKSSAQRIKVAIAEKRHPPPLY